MNAGYQLNRSDAKRPAWLVTFADLVALLITFFVMLFATQKVDIGRWESLVDTLSMRLNPNQTILIARPSADKNAERLSRERAIDLDYLEKVIQSKARDQPELAGLNLARHDDRLIVMLPTELLFRPGKADPVETARPVLFVLAGVLATIGNRIDVVGHADPRPIENSHFASNWQLSIARAVAVANELRRAGYHREMSPSGFGAAAFRELPSDLPIEYRIDLARRVDVVIWPTRGIQ
jgi:chemotaxis protein MotB